MTAASATLTIVRVPTLTPAARIPAESATADTAFKRFEPAFINPITLLPVVPRGIMS
jgi:hypothetical protein